MRSDLVEEIEEGVAEQADEDYQDSLDDVAISRYIDSQDY